jgi:hypothetical protein
MKDIESHSNDSETDLNCVPLVLLKVVNRFQAA